jgi:hypothetical protein
VREKHPFDGPLVLRVAGHDHTLGERVAQQIFVRKKAPADLESDDAESGYDHVHRKEQAL